MCGICGIFSLTEARPDAGKTLRMRDALSRRGPDDEGFVQLQNAALGFKRLSILDIANGHQPMLSPDGAVALVFNGEIYNHPELKKELKAAGETYKTRSDTETILRLYLKEGAGCLKKLKGMFAFAIFDSRSGEILLARDPLGIKPLYYTLHGGELLFSSELRSLLKSGVPRRLDPHATADYLRFGFVHSPKTIVAGVRKLPPGHFLRVKTGALELPEPRRFYAINAHDTTFARLNETELAAMLEELLGESVRQHLLSDVPVGAFLSGGIDSSLITALMVKHYPGKIKTFSIGFSGARRGLNESSHAKTVADYLGTDHNELILPATVLKDIPRLVLALDEPIADSAILPTYLLAEHAKKSVKVVLSGEGADELFGGYGRYKAAYLSYQINKLPKLLGKMAGKTAKTFGKDKIFKSAPFADQHAWAEALAHSSPGRIAAALMPEHKQLAADLSFPWLENVESGAGFNNLLLLDLRTILADCLLMKVDKATMAASLEARVPFLTPELAAFALNLPPETKIKNFKSKWLLRRVARKYLPQRIAARPKHGFWVPWEEWISSKPAEVRRALSSAELGGEELLDTKAIAAQLDALAGGARGIDSGLLFRVGVLALWHQSIY